MKKLYIAACVLILCAFLTSNLNAQNLQWAWSKSYGNTAHDAAQKIAADSRGSVYTLGTFRSSTLTMGATSLANNGVADIFLCRHDTLGNLIWAKSFGSIGLDSAGAITTDRNGDIIFAGSFSNSITLGTTTFTSAGGSNSFVAKADNAGNIIWARHFSSAGESMPGALKTDSWDNIYLAGSYTGADITVANVLLANANSTNVYYAKLNTSGAGIWVKKNSSNAAIFSVYNIELLPADRILLLGYAKPPSATAATVDFSPTPPGAPSFLSILMFTVKMDTAGNFINQKSGEAPGSLTTPAMSRIGNNFDVLTVGRYLTLTGSMYAFFNTSDSNFVTRNISLGGGTSIANAAFGTELQYAEKRSFFAGFGTGLTNYGSGLQISQPGKGYTFILEKDTMGVSKRIIYTESPTGSSGEFNGSAIDTSTNSLYFAGSISGNSKIGFYRDSVQSNGLTDIVISKVSINGYLPYTMQHATICSGASVNIGLGSSSGGGPAPHTYAWSPTTGLSNPTNSNTVASPTTTTTYTLLITDGLGNTSTQSVTINVNPAPAIPTITANGSLNICAGGTVILTSSSATGNTWSNGLTTQSITVGAAGTYFVTVSNGICNSVSASVSVTVSPAVAQPTITASGALSFCQGGSVTLTASSGVSYIWSNGATTQSIIVTTSGTYTVQVFNGTCLSAASAGTTVQVNPLPATPTITASGPVSFCAGGSVTLSASGGSTYLWSNGATTASIIVNTPGNYSVQVSNGTCTSLTSAAVTVQVHPLPTAPTITASGPLSFCTGGFVTLTASSASSYLWSTGATTQSITVNTAGNYSVQVSNGTCTSPAAVVAVVVNALPATPSITAGGSTTICPGGSVTLTSSAGSSYLWSTGATTQSITVSSAGNYSVQITNAQGCISAPSASTTVQVASTPATPTVTAGGPLSFCQGGSVTLTASSASAYQWSNGATTQSITVNSSGNYSVIVSNSQGCTSAASSTQAVMVYALPPVPTITQSGNTLTASTASAYQWFLNGSIIPGATSNPYIYSVPGEYTVQITDANGCQAISLGHTANLTAGITTLSNGELFFHQVTPNPMTTTGQLRYQLQSSSKISIAIMESSGKLITYLLREKTQPAGNYLIPITTNIRQMGAGRYIVVYMVNNDKITDGLIIAR
jgi:hypothetical protein